MSDDLRGMSVRELVEFAIYSHAMETISVQPTHLSEYRNRRGLVIAELTRRCEGAEKAKPKPDRPVCEACGEEPGSEHGSGQHRITGASLCRDCFMEWYDGDRPDAGTDESNNCKAVGEWVKYKRRMGLLPARAATDAAKGGE